MAGAQVKISALPASAAVASADIIPFVRSGVTDYATAGNFRTQLFAFAAADPLNCGILTATGNSTITGTLSGVTTFTATTGTFTNLTVPTAAQPNITSLGTLTSLVVTSLSSVQPLKVRGDNVTGAGQVRIESLTATIPRLTLYEDTTFQLGIQASTAGGVVFDAQGNLPFLFGGTGDATFGGKLIMSAAVARIVPGATSLSFRNNANNADNLILTDAGVATIRAGLTLTAGPLTFGAAAQKIALPSGSYIDFRTASDAGSGLRVYDTGIVQLPSNYLALAASTTAYASLQIPSGSAPTSPLDGAMWYNGASLFFRAGGVTKTITWS